VTSIKKFGVLGAGQMGAGIAQVAATKGLSVVLVDISPAQIEKAKASLASSMDRLIKKAVMTEEQKTKALGLIQFSSSTKDFVGCQAVVEAVSENIELKSKIFTELDAILDPSALLLSNTSSISITLLAAKTKRPDKVAGMHFMNPVPIMTLVEGIRGLQTSDTTFALMRALTEQLGKVFVEAKDQPGFVVNRILMPMINEAVFALQEGLATAEGIDQAMKLGTNQPMGPLTLADFIGLDTCLSIMRVLHDGLGDPKYRPCPLLVKYVEAGWLGKKSGRGFYTY
jgi:3-hydroxybutyryl-CoA dehydrogenase